MADERLKEKIHRTLKSGDYIDHAVFCHERG